MKKVLILFFAVISFLPLFAELRTVEAGNSYSEFTYIVMVGQIVEVTPFSVVFENTAYGTTASNEKIRALNAYFNYDNDFRSHGMANALYAASVKDGKMRLSFYIDNILKIFDDNVTTYMKYIPLYYLFKNNIENLKLPEQTMESLKKQSIDYYISLPMAQELMKNSWLAAVFTINPSNNKLTFKTGRFFDNFDELNESEWAAEYRIPDIVKAGMTVSMTKTVFIGHEAEEADKKAADDKKKGRSKGDRKQFYNGQGTTYGTER